MHIRYRKLEQLHKELALELHHRSLQEHCKQPCVRACGKSILLASLVHIRYRKQVRNCMGQVLEQVHSKMLHHYSPSYDRKFQQRRWRK